MSIIKTFDVTCDSEGCIEWTNGSVGYKTTTAEARRIAALAGWVSRYGKDYCPKHKDTIG